MTLTNVKAILDSLKNFLTVWKEKKGPEELGQKIGDLRTQNFRSSTMGRGLS